MINISKEYDDIISSIDNNASRNTPAYATADIYECEELAKAIGTTTSQWRRRVALTTEIFAESLRRLSIREGEVAALERKCEGCNEEIDDIWMQNAELQSKIKSVEKLLQQEDIQQQQQQQLMHSSTNHHHSPLHRGDFSSSRDMIKKQDYSHSYPRRSNHR